MPADKLPPFDAEAEESVIAAALVDADSVPLLAEIVQPGTFFRESNRWCWQAVLELRRRGEAVNQITVAHELNRAGKLTEIGGAAYLSKLVTELPTCIGSESYARIVRRDATYRRLITAAGQIAQDAFKGGADEREVVVRALSRLQEVNAAASTDGMTPISDVLAGWLERPEIPERGVIPPWAKLQKYLPVLRNGSLYVLAGYTSRGKTSWALHLIRETVLAGRRAVLVSLEMRAEMVAARLIASEAGVDSRKVEAGLVRLHEVEQAKVNAALGRLAAAPLWIDDRTRDIGDMEARVTAHKIRHGLDLLVVDHLQEMSTATPRLNATERTSELAERTRALAASLDVPTLLLSQLRRDAERGYHEPGLSDLRQSGRIEEAAEAVIFLYDESPRVITEAHPVEVIVGKNRMGETGKARMTFWPALCRFSDD